jgi:hypothetical protein
MKSDHRAVGFVLLRTAGLVALALFLILVIFPAALAAQSTRTS